MGRARTTVRPEAWNSYQSAELTTADGSVDVVENLENCIVLELNDGLYLSFIDSQGNGVLLTEPYDAIALKP